MGSVMLIAGNAFREALSMKLVYAVLLLGFGIVMITTLPMAMFDYALEGGDQDDINFFMFIFVNLLLNGFWLISAVLALLLGSMAVSGEIKRRTIVTVLARPVERWQYMAGRWIGIAAFLAIVQTIAVLLSVALVTRFGVYPSSLIYVAILHNYVSLLVYLTVALALGALVSAAASFAITIMLLLIVPFFIEEAIEFTWGTNRTVLSGLQHLFPAMMPDDLLSDSFTLGQVNPDYTLYYQVIGENALFAAAFFCICAVLFSRRQIIAGS